MPDAVTWWPRQAVRIREGVTDPAQGAVVPGAEYRIEGLWKDIAGRSWMDSDGNIACLHYAMRAAANSLPTDNDVLYGKIGGYGHLVHVSEIEVPDGRAEYALTYDQAVALLPGGDRVHTFLDGGIALIGADWDRADVLALLRDGRPELSGDAATAMGHGMVAFRATGPVFIATREEVPGA